MNPLTVIWTRPALNDVGRLEERLRQRIVERVDDFARTRRGDLETIKGEKDTYRLRVGEWRVVFRWDKDAETIHIRRVRPRGGAYRP